MTDYTPLDLTVPWVLDKEDKVERAQSSSEADTEQPEPKPNPCVSTSVPGAFASNTSCTKGCCSGVPGTTPYKESAAAKGPWGVGGGPGKRCSPGKAGAPRKATRSSPRKATRSSPDELSSDEETREQYQERRNRMAAEILERAMALLDDLCNGLEDLPSIFEAPMETRHRPQDMNSCHVDSFLEIMEAICENGHSQIFESLQEECIKAKVSGIWPGIV